MRDSCQRREPARPGCNGITTRRRIEEQNPTRRALTPDPRTPAASGHQHLRNTPYTPPQTSPRPTNSPAQFPAFFAPALPRHRHAKRQPFPFPSPTKHLHAHAPNPPRLGGFGHSARIGRFWVRAARPEPSRVGPKKGCFGQGAARQELAQLGYGEHPTPEQAKSGPVIYNPGKHSFEPSARTGQHS